MKEDDIPVGVTLLALYKCEEPTCGALFIRAVDCRYDSNEVVCIECPHGHRAVKFIQTVERAALLPGKPIA